MFSLCGNQYISLNLDFEFVFQLSVYVFYGILFKNLTLRLTHFCMILFQCYINFVLIDDCTLCAFFVRFLFFILYLFDMFLNSHKDMMLMGLMKRRCNVWAFFSFEEVLSNVHEEKIHCACFN